MQTSPLPFQLGSTIARENAYWGNIQFFLYWGDETGQGYWGHEYIGQVELTGNRYGSISSRTFQIPESLVPRLSAPHRPRLSFVISTSHGDWGETLVMRSIEITPVTSSLPIVSCDEIPPWQNNTAQGGDKIRYNDEVYECISGITAPWCLLAGYASGTTYWGQAWKKVGVCQ